jgi:hypothetical protein
MKQPTLLDTWRGDPVSELNLTATHLSTIHVVVKKNRSSVPEYMCLRRGKNITVCACESMLLTGDLSDGSRIQAIVTIVTILTWPPGTL